MTQNTTFALDSKFKEMLPKFLRQVEGSKPNQPNVSIVHSGQSGLTVGEVQMDVSKKPDLAADMLRVGKEKKLEGSDTMTVAMLQRRHDSGLSDADKAKMVKFAKDVLATPEGAKALSSAEDRQIRELGNAVEKLCKDVDPRAAPMCGTLEGQLRFASYMHQQGTNVDELRKVVQGGTGNIGKSKTHPNGIDVKLDGEMTPEWFDTTYVGQTAFAQEFPKAAKSRVERAKSFNSGTQPTGPAAQQPAQQRPVPPPPTPAPRPPAANPEQRGDADAQMPETQHAQVPDDEQLAEETPTQLAEAQATPQSLQQPMQRYWESQPPPPPFNFLDPTMKSPRHNLPSGLAKLLGIPHAPGGGGSDGGQFAELAKQVGGEGLPSLISDLLGSGVSRTNPKSAVKLFQNTINALNKPADFDWNWSTSGKIDVDGDLGPQTRNGFGRAIEKAGPEGFARKLALGQFRDYATKLDNGVERYENLAGAVDGSLGRIDQNAAATFQDYLNAAREELPPHARYEGLKRDGWIGPKTTDAFKKVLYVAGPKSIADDLEGLFGA